MLVLSRRVNEKVLFPGISASVQVLGVRGNAVRLGVQAPPEVKVLREEVPDRQAGSAPPCAGAERPALARLVGNRLRVAGVGLAVLVRQLREGGVEDALLTADHLAEDLWLLRRRVAEEVGAPPAPEARRPRKALLVEDNANERELLAEFLRLGGFEVDTAEDGAEALDYLRGRGKPDVVLLDMGLPRCDGPTTVREIRRDPACAGLKVVAVTGRRPEECGLGQGPGGIDRWFRKPINPPDLIRALEGELNLSTPS
jgi:carbon storage regulator CsrA